VEGVEVSLGGDQVEIKNKLKIKFLLSKLS